MKLSLLTPPTESPRDVPHVPIPQGWPGERQIAISTEGLPRQLPQTAMNPAVASAPWEALARFGATGAAVSSDILSTVLHAKMLRQEAIDLADVDRIFTDTVNQFEPEFEKHKVTSTIQTFRPGFDALWQDASSKAMQQAQNPEVAKHLASKLRAFSITKTAEAAVVDREKLKDYNTVEFFQAMKREQRLATEAPTEATRDYHLAEIDATAARYGRAGSIDLPIIVKTREDTLDTIRIDRTYADGYADPLTMSRRILQGDTFGMDKKELRNYSEYLDNRFRTMRSDLENTEARKRRDDKEKEDEHAVTWRQKISANYAAGGPNADLTQMLNEDARRLGKENHASLEALHQSRREHFLKPGPARQSDDELVGRVQNALASGRLNEFSQNDLLGFFQNHNAGGRGLNENDYTRFSNQLDGKLQHLKTEGKTAKTEAEKVRESQTKDAEKLIDDYLSRGSRFQGDPASKTSDVLIRDATTELHTRLQSDPSLHPITVANELIGGRIKQVQEIAQTLPYKTKQEVAEAYAAKRIDAQTANRYYYLLDAIAKQQPQEPLVVAPKPLTPWQLFYGRQPNLPTPVTPGAPPPTDEPVRKPQKR